MHPNPFPNVEHELHIQLGMLCVQVPRGQGDQFHFTAPHVQKPHSIDTPVSPPCAVPRAVPPGVTAIFTYVQIPHTHLRT
jgi:hypothetical protein